MQNSKPILLVEDDSADVMIVEHALKDLNITNEMIHSANGEEALEYLNGKSNRKPCIILLDLNMPRMNGIEFLKIVKSNEVLRKIPVIVLSTSQEEFDVAESFNLSVAGYMVKPVDYKQFVETIRAIKLYWTLSESATN